MRHTLGITVALLLLVLSASQASAQSRWAAEFRAGGGITTSDLGESELDPGLGFDVTVRYRLQPHLWVYGGWDWYHFMTSDTPADIDVEDTGYAFGLRFEHPVGTSPLSLWVRGGGIYDHVELEDEDGDLIADSGHDLGFEVGGGLAFGIADDWALTPGVRWRTVDHELDTGEGVADVELSYLALEIGVVWHF